MKLPYSFAVLATTFLLAMTRTALAYPEFVRHGYQNCASCHVSPSGGGILTDYGRSFSAEKLSTYSYPGEERPLHGSVGELPEWFMLGGNFRQIQTLVETPRSRDGRWIRMQQDIEACLKAATILTCGTAGMTRPASQSDSGKAEYGLRKFAVRFDVHDAWILRVGRFYPKFGLMLANHTSPVRRGMGFDALMESDQVEFNYLSEWFEATLARDFGDAVQLNSVDDDIQLPLGWNGAVNVPLGEKSRGGIHARHLGDEIAYGISLALGPTESTFFLAEVDRREVQAENSGNAVSATSAMASHLRLGSEVWRGVAVYGMHEMLMPDARRTLTRRDTYGIGLQWFPRPHVELEGFVGHLLFRESSQYAHIASFLLHYYL
jgi:hypothetical protein